MISISEGRRHSPERMEINFKGARNDGNRWDNNKRGKKKWGKTVRATDAEIFLSRLRTTRVRLNVGGECHEVMWRTLKRMPFTRLGLLRKALTHEQIMEICDDYDLKKNEYYFDRHPKSFLCVLTMFRTGNLHMLEDLCIVNFANDLEYWGINENLMESCCHHRYHMKRERMNDEIKKVKDIDDESNQVEQFGANKFHQFRKKVWDLMENPQTSIAAQVCGFLFWFVH